MAAVLLGGGERGPASDYLGPCRSSGGAGGSCGPVMKVAGGRWESLERRGGKRNEGPKER
jgi:hypothetical protein